MGARGGCFGQADEEINLKIKTDLMNKIKDKVGFNAKDKVSLP